MGILTVKTVALCLCFAAALHQGCGQFGNIAAPNRNFYYRGAQLVRLPVTQYRPLVPQYFRGFYPLPRVVQAQPQTRRVSPLRQFLNLWAWNRVLNPPATAPPPTTEMPTTPTTIPATSITTSTAMTTEATTATTTTASTTENPLCSGLHAQAISAGNRDLRVWISADVNALDSSGVCQVGYDLIVIADDEVLSSVISSIRSQCGETSAILWTANTKEIIDNNLGGGNTLWYNSEIPTIEPDSKMIHRLRVDSSEAGFLPDEDGATADGALCANTGSVGS